MLSAVAAVFFRLLLWLAGKPGMGEALDYPGAGLLLIALTLLPAGVLATWQARKPPWQQGLPD